MGWSIICYGIDKFLVKHQFKVRQSAFSWGWLSMSTQHKLSVPTILDCDPGHDDALAIMLAAASAELNLIAVTTVAGNGGIERVTDNALRVCALAGIDNIRIAQGARNPLLSPATGAKSIHGESALDGAELPTPRLALERIGAVDLMADIVSSAKDPVTLIATGPLTNIALFIKMHPQLLIKINRISLMGGSTDRGNWTPLAEFNIWADPEAADIVFQSSINIFMTGLNISHQVLITKEIFSRLRGLDTHLSRTINPLLEFFAHTYDTVFGMPDPPLHDPIAVFAVSHPELMTFIECNVSVEKNGTLTRGATVVDIHGVTGKASNAKVAIGIDVDAFWYHMIQAIKELG